MSSLISSPEDGTARADSQNRLLRALFAPRAIAVVGASDDPLKISGRPLDYLVRYGYDGQIYPVNNRREVVQGRVSYPSLAAVPGPVDLALLGLPADAVVEALRECADAGAAVAVVFAAGFGETGEVGRGLQDEIERVCRETGIRVLGPNCLGVIGLRSGVTATFASALDDLGTLLTGPAAFVTQSGAFGTFIFSAAQGAGIGFSHFANTGNEVDLSVAELCLALIEEPEVKVVLGYLEGVRDGEDMLRLGRRARDLDKPVVAVKVGRTAAGARAAASHTASLAGADAVYDSVTRAAGILRVDGMNELIDAARIFSNGRRAHGPRLSIVTMSGGAGALMTDLAIAQGLEVPEWEPQWRERAAALLPRFGSARNPIDVTANLLSRPTLLEGPLRTAIENPATDIVCVMVGNSESGQAVISESIRAGYESTDKPFVVTWTGGSGNPLRWLSRHGIPTFDDPGRAAAALGLLHQWSRSGTPVAGPPARNTSEARAMAQAVIARARAAGRDRLDEVESKAILRGYGLPCVNEQVAEDPDTAREAAERIGFPVAVKLLSADVAHKTELGGVHLDILDGEGVVRAARAVLERAAAAGVRDARVLVQEMCAPGVELVLGVKNDPTFGPVVLAGFGGVLVELLSDSALAVPPFDVGLAGDLLGKLRGSKLLDGFRGRPAHDRGAAAAALAALSSLAADLGDEIAELDVNPVVVGHEGEGCVAVDALVMLR